MYHLGFTRQEVILSSISQPNFFTENHKASTARVNCSMAQKLVTARPEACPKMGCAI